MRSTYFSRGHSRCRLVRMRRRTINWKRCSLKRTLIYKMRYKKL
jgi:hypothetical protein